MRRLVLLALMALAAYPLSAHGGRWHSPRRVWVVARDGCREADRRGEDDRWEDRGRWAYRDHGYRSGERPYGCEDDDRMLLRPRLRPLTPPFQARVEFWLR